MKRQLSEKYQILDGAALKWIAMISMLIDHVNKGILINYQIFYCSENRLLNVVIDMLEILGRIAFPIFLFLLVEGFVYTRSRKKYFLQLVFFGCLSEVPYDMFESGCYVDKGGQNMFFTLALALLTLCFVEKIRGFWPRMWIPVSLFAALYMGYLASAWGLDYHYYGILIPYVLYVLRDRRIPASVLSYLIVLKELWSVLGFLAVNLYNGKRGKINKWIGYWFYPAHLFLIGLIRMFILKV